MLEDWLSNMLTLGLLQITLAPEVLLTEGHLLLRENKCGNIEVS
jgi:hypothetical protein